MKDKSDSMCDFGMFLKRKMILAWCLTAPLVLSSCATTPVETVPLDPPPVVRTPAAPAQVTQRTDNVQIGDTLELFVSEDATFNGTYKVREKGDIILPRLGRVEVENLSIAAVEARVKGLLENSQLREATVIVDRTVRAPQPVQTAGTVPETEEPKILAYFTGHVKRAGQHWITLPRGNPVGIYEGILISGGLARFANERKVEVLRKSDDGETKRMLLDLKAVREGDAPDPPLYEGDIVFVPEKRIGM
jgi:protein involved in polysaccharide export with SLBB domain